MTITPIHGSVFHTLMVDLAWIGFFFTSFQFVQALSKWIRLTCFFREQEIKNVYGKYPGMFAGPEFEFPPLKEKTINFVIFSIVVLLIP